MFTLERRNFPGAHQTLASISCGYPAWQSQRETNKKRVRGGHLTDCVCVWVYIRRRVSISAASAEWGIISYIHCRAEKRDVSWRSGPFFVFRSAQTGVKTHSLVFGICWRLSLAGDKQIRAIDLLENGSIQIEFHLLNKTDTGAKTFHFIFSCPGNRGRVSLMIRKAGSANNRQRHTVRALSLCVCTRVEFCSFSFLAIERSVVAREVEKHAAAAHAAFYIGGSPCDRNPYRSPARSHSRK